MALVTAHRGTGVINIAQGAIAVWGAYVFQDARVVHGLATPVAMMAGLVAVLLLSLGLHVLVFRPLRTAPALSRVVASVGVTITIQALVVLEFGTARRSVPPTLPNDPIHL